MKKLTKRQQIINYFIEHPDATPKAASKKFGVALTTIYMLRKQAARGDAAPEAVKAIVEVRANDWQVGGDHYKAMGVEPWDVVDTWPIEQRIGAYRHGALKYIMRMGSKDQSAQEIAKGQHYLQKLLEVLNGGKA